jgi:hypothetical protein
MDAELTLAQAREAYFAANHLGDGGYAEPTVRVRFGPFAVDVPNTSARRRAVPLHDLHHALTGYGSDWRGECTIGAWETAAGCGGYAAAWVLVLASFGLGVVAYPRAAWRGFMRGRGAGNLFTDHPRGETAELLATTLRESRARYGLDRGPRRARIGDAIAFAAWATLAIPLMLVFGAGMLALAIAQGAWRIARWRSAAR